MHAVETDCARRQYCLPDASVLFAQLCAIIGMDPLDRGLNWEVDGGLLLDICVVGLEMHPISMCRHDCTQNGPCYSIWISTIPATRQHVMLDLAIMQSSWLAHDAHTDTWTHIPEQQPQLYKRVRCAIYRPMLGQACVTCAVHDRRNRSAAKWRYSMLAQRAQDSQTSRLAGILTSSKVA